jgi:hypothetical protein
MDERPARDWWELVEEHLARGDHDLTGDHEADDPWSEAGAAPALTDAQRALLGGIDDQPGVPRVSHHADEHDDQPPMPRFARADPDDGSRDSTTGNMPGDST